MRATFTLFLLIAFFSPLFGEHHKIQVLLTNPRSVSTAFEKSIMARGDHKVFHEPWVVSYMYHEGHSDVFSQIPPLELRNAQGYQAVKELIYSCSASKPVFLKDMVWCMGEDILNDEQLLSDPDVIFTFLIRDPALAMESFFLKGSEKMSFERTCQFTPMVFCYDTLVRIAEKYREVRGIWPIIIEAEDLCRSPNETLQSFCHQAKIPYHEESLHWNEGMPEEWKHLASWHHDAAESNHFYIPQRDQTKERFTLIPKEYFPLLETVYQNQKPFYDALRAMKK